MTPQCQPSLTDRARDGTVASAKIEREFLSITRRQEDRIQAEATRMGCRVGAIGGIEDHVHVLVRYPPTVSISELVKQIKGVSSRLVQQEVRLGEFFKWQGSYGAFSIAQRDGEMVRRYIHRREEHHRTGRLNATLERTMTDDPPARAHA
jgi:REP element-mobilizing transposase RayT